MSAKMFIKVEKRQDYSFSTREQMEQFYL